MLPAALRVLLVTAVCALAIVASDSAHSAPARTGYSARISGIDYVDLAAFCAKFGLEPASTSSRRSVFKSKWTTLDFEIDARDHLINGIRVYTGEPVRSYRGRLWLSEIDADALVTPILRAGDSQARVPALKTIVIDPGHGGRDPGKVNTRVKILEKNAALDTARRAKALLESQGYKVFLTRPDDRYLDLSLRAEIAGRHNADLFVSLHFNSVEAGANKVTGVEVYSLTPQYQYSTGDWAREGRADAKVATAGNRFDHWNTAASYAMHRELITTLGVTDRGLKRARWRVLVLAPCPATYIEAGYLSNDTEARKIATPAYRQKIAEALAQGVRAYAAALAQARARS